MEGASGMQSAEESIDIIILGGEKFAPGGNEAPPPGGNEAPPGENNAAAPNDLIDYITKFVSQVYQAGCNVMLKSLKKLLPNVNSVGFTFFTVILVVDIALAVLGWAFHNDFFKLLAQYASLGCAAVLAIQTFLFFFYSSMRLGHTASKEALSLLFLEVTIVSIGATFIRYADDMCKRIASACLGTLPTFVLASTPFMTFQTNAELEELKTKYAKVLSKNEALGLKLGQFKEDAYIISHIEKKSDENYKLPKEVSLTKADMQDLIATDLVTKTDLANESMTMKVYLEEKFIQLNAILTVKHKKDTRRRSI